MGLDARQSESGAQAVAAAERPERVIAVLGMHRSGTSALVGSLQRHGLFLGQHSTRNRYNPLGNRENRRVVLLNDAVLRDSGGSWSAPPAEVRWADGHFAEARTMLASFAGRPIWGFKDPRTLLTLEGWRSLVPDLEFAGVFRHPARVARSLASRPEFPVQDPLGLWRTYNERLLALHREHPFPVLSFDEDPATVERDLERVSALLGLPAARDAEPFFAPKLRHPDVAPGDLPDDVSALYEELRRIAI